MKLHKYIYPTILGILAFGHLSNTCKVLYYLNPVPSNDCLDWFTAIILGIGIGVSTVIFALSGQFKIAVLASVFDILISLVYYNTWYKGDLRLYVTIFISIGIGLLIFGYSELVKDYKEEKKKK